MFSKHVLLQEGFHIPLLDMYKTLKLLEYKRINT